MLAVLHLAVGLTGVGWVAGLACGVAVAGLLSSGLARRHRAPGPADVVTLGRSTLVGGVAALAASDAAPAVLVAMAAVALCLDGVDGRVARRTGTASDLGARFDMEVDALLVLLLSWQVASTTGHPWVLLIGSARYLKGLAAIVWPWWGLTAPPRTWAKTVAVVQGVVLTVTAAEVLPHAITTAALVFAALLLAESFATEARWLWRHRPATTPHPARERLLTAAALCWCRWPWPPPTPWRSCDPWPWSGSPSRRWSSWAWCSCCRAGSTACAAWWRGWPASPSARWPC